MQILKLFFYQNIYGEEILDIYVTKLYPFKANLHTNFVAFLPPLKTHFGANFEAVRLLEYLWWKNVWYVLWKLYLFKANLHAKFCCIFAPSENTLRCKFWVCWVIREFSLKNLKSAQSEEILDIFAAHCIHLRLIYTPNFVAFLPPWKHTLVQTLKLFVY